MQTDRAEQLAVVEKFLAAISTGDMQGLMDVLAPDVVAIADGGGVMPALRRPVIGAEKLAAMLVPRVAEFPGFVATTAWLNGMPGARLDFDGIAAAMSLVVEDGRITRIYAINNPHKLGSLEQESELRR